MDQAGLISLFLSLVTANNIVEFQQQQQHQLQQQRPHEQLITPKFCNELDCPKYKVLTNYGDFEERQYAAASWVTTTMTGVDFEKAESAMFMKLFGYINKGNKQGKKIKMTAPVKTRIIPGQGPACESNFTMSFFVAPDQEPAPQPSDSSIFIENIESETFYVRHFGGFARKYVDWKDEALKLGDSLKQAKLSDFKTKYYYACGYDSPFRLFNRHNEIWFIKTNNV